MASSIVAVAGGTGKLGRAIVESLVASGGFKILVLAREVSETRSKELGVEVLAVDYTDEGSIIQTLENNKVDTVISVLSPMAGVGPELALIKAAQASKATRRYIPSSWGMKNTAEVARIFPMTQDTVTNLEFLSSTTSLEWTAVHIGFFLDYWVIPHVKSYLGGFAMAIDIANKTAAIPGSGNTPVTFTYSFDIGNFVAALLSSPSRWEKDSYIIGDKVTLNEFLAIAEEARGSRFKTTHDSLEMLRSGQVTELPVHLDLYSNFPKTELLGLCASFGILFEEGFFDFRSEGSLNEQFPKIATRKVKDLLDKAWKGR